MNKLEIKRIEEFISKDKIPDAFSYLLSTIENELEFTNLREELIIKKSLFTRVESDKRKGIIDYETYFLQRSNVVHVLLNVSYELSNLNQVEEEILNENLNYSDLKEEIENIKKRLEKIEVLIPIIEEKFNLKLDKLSKSIKSSGEKSQLIRHKERIETQLNSYKRKVKVQEPKINYVFIFGNTNTGKTTLLASIIQHLTNKYKVQYNSTSNPDGFNYMLDIVKSLETNRFPNRTEVGEIKEIDLAFRGDEDNSIVITFLDMSGEEMRLINKNNSIEINNSYTKYLNSSSKIQFLINTTPNTAKTDDYLIYMFINFIETQYKEIEYSISLIVNKWDTMSDVGIDLNTFIKQNLIKTYSYLSNQRMKIKFHKYSAIADKDTNEDLSEIINKLINEFKTTPNNVPTTIASIRRLLRRH